MLTDVSRSLRDEERQAWQRLIRVIGHEINNSLAPIKSIAHSLERLLTRDPRAEDWETDMRGGLAVIGSRADSLGRFTAAYAQLARLPAPALQPVSIGTLVPRAAGLERAHDRCRARGAAGHAAGGPRSARAAADQHHPQRGRCHAPDRRRACRSAGTSPTPRVRIFVDDEGPGLPNTANLFVPFFTTKPEGSGIGLVLSRQIAEAHGGTLTLENRTPGPGCRAVLTLPLA